MISVYAQHAIYIGAKAGISIPNLRAGSDNPLVNGFSTSLGADFGVLAEFKINRWLSIQPEIDYSQEGGKRDGLQPLINPFPDIVNQPYLYANYKSAVRLNYLMIPVMAKFSFKLSGKFNFYTNVGVFGGLLLGGKTMLGDSSHIYLDPAGTQEQTYYPNAVFAFNDNENIKDSLKNFNAGVILFIGFSYNIGNGKIFIEGGGNYGIIGVQKNPDNGTNYAGAITAHLGYEFILRRRKKR
jgi:hypothetical protein